MMVYGLLSQGVGLESQRYLFSDRCLETFMPTNAPTCFVCSPHEKNVWAKGDKATLPCRRQRR